MSWNVLPMFRRRGRSRKPLRVKPRLERLEDRLAPATLPTGFSETLIASGLSRPTAMAFAPDGRLFVCEQGGKLRVIDGGTLLATPFVTLTVSSVGERGLLGVAFDPDFVTNQYVYVYYTATSPTVHNRVSRFTADGNVALPGSEIVIMDLENLGATNHNGGAIHFGPDGKLYVATGENAVPQNAQSLNNRLGKILRINPDGSIPTDNPFYNQATGDNRAIWALGLRNPFTFAFQAGTGRMFINDVGQSSWEEINDGIAGSNYGWPIAEGAIAGTSFRNPLFQYAHGNSSTTGIAITGGAFYNPGTVSFPSHYVGDYFFADFGSGWIRRYDPESDSAVDFAQGISFPVDLKVNDDGSLYYLARGGGKVWRVQYTPAPPPAGTVTLTTNISPPTFFGAAVTFTATVVQGVATPTGTITFLQNGTLLGSESLDSNGQAFFTTSSLIPGNYAITATYSGDGNYDPATSVALIRTVLKMEVTATVASSAAPSVFGENVVFTATITNASGTGVTPAGTVTFRDGNATLGTATLDGSGRATFATSSMTVRTHTISVIFAGDSNQSSATSAPFLQTVAKATTSTTVVNAAPNPSWPNQPVSFTVSVSNTSGTGAIPTGTVTFKAGTTTLGSAVLDDSGIATFTKTLTKAETHTIRASYAGSANFVGSTAAIYLQSVARANTSISLTSSGNPSSLGQVVTFTATVSVSSPWTGTPTGKVTFKEGTVTLGSGAINSFGAATLTKSNLTTGTHSITAVYAGNASFNPSSQAIDHTVTVGAATTTAIVGWGPDPAFPDDVVTITAVVSSGSGTPAGTVLFKDGAATIGSATLDGSGTASILWTAVKTAGTRTLRAVYAANTGFASSTSSAVTQTIVRRVLSSLVVSADPSPAGAGSPAVYTATVSGSGGGPMPTGKVTFQAGTVTLGSATLNTGGVATLTRALPTAGTHSITAIYGGDKVYGSTTALYLQTVSIAATTTTTTVTSSTAPFASLPGQMVTFTAAVMGAGGTPSGLVTFKAGNTMLGTAILSGGTATLANMLTAVSIHTITAIYGGDGTYLGSTGTFAQTVTRATTTVLSFDNVAIIAGQPISFTATVTSPTAIIPTGLVTFRDGATVIGTATLSSGSATLNSTALRVAGTHTLRAVYGGGNGFAASTSSTMLLVVNKADTTLSLTSNINPSSFGQAVTFTAVLTVANPGTLGVPAGTITFKKGSVTLGTANINASTGIATFTRSNLSAGMEHTIVAIYGGSTAYNTSTTSYVQTLLKATSTTLTVSPTIRTANMVLTFTTTVTGADGIPTGTVTFRDGGSELGTALLDGSGQATFTYEFASTGLCTLSAAYSGDLLFSASTSEMLKLNLL